MVMYKHFKNKVIKGYMKFPMKNAEKLEVVVLLPFCNKKPLISIRLNCAARWTVTSKITALLK